LVQKTCVTLSTYRTNFIEIFLQFFNCFHSSTSFRLKIRQICKGFPTFHNGWTEVGVLTENCPYSFHLRPQITPVLFVDLKLLDKSAIIFVLRWNLLNKTFLSPFWAEICMGGTLRTQNFKILSTQFSLKYNTYLRKIILRLGKFPCPIHPNRLTNKPQNICLN
jgi:hypothetical protein